MGLLAPDALLAQLLAAYTEPQRHYHTLQHLGECLTQVEPVLLQLDRPGEVELALWFHDAIYDVKAHDNELRSAQWAAQALQAAHASNAQVEKVHALIMATQHGAAPINTLIDADTQRLLDIDLAILGASPERFAQYDRQVRAEYAWVPHAIYRAKRQEVLQGFLQRPHIYGSAEFTQRLEAQARTNLSSALSAL